MNVVSFFFEFRVQIYSGNVRLDFNMDEISLSNVAGFFMLLEKKKSIARV